MLLIYIRFMWLLSMVGLLVMLSVINVYLPTHVVFQMENVLEFGYGFTKETFFYVCLAFAIFVNASLLAFGNLYAYLPKPYIFVPKKAFWLQDREHHIRLAKNFKSWTKGIMFFCNLILIYFLLSVWALHDQFVRFNTAWVFPLLVFGLLAWFCYYFILFYNTAHDRQ
jgi:hypothetical protein